MNSNPALFTDLCDAVDQDRLVARLQEMIAIRSENPFAGDPRPGYREKEIGEYYLDHMNELGLAVNQREAAPGRPNVFGSMPGAGGGPTLMLAGHLDTVSTDNYPDAYDARYAGGRVYGRGSCDMKAALSAYLEVVRVLRDAGVTLNGTLILCGVADEEYQLIGSRDIGMNGPRADQGIIGEPSDLSICPAHKGQLSTFIRTFGKAVHSSIPERGENAIERMARVIQALSGYNRDLAGRPPHPLCGHGRYSPGVIRGGDLVSAVPDYCELEVDRRILPGETRDQVFDDYRARIDPLKDLDPTFRYEITDPSWDIPANDIPVDTPVVQSLLMSYRTLTGRDAEPVAFPGATDAPNLGFPAVVCGPGSLVQAHSIEEYVEVEQVLLATRMYLAAVLDVLG